MTGRDCETFETFCRSWLLDPSLRRSSVWWRHILASARTVGRSWIW